MSKTLKSKNHMTMSMDIEGLDACLRKMKLYDTQSQARVEHIILMAGRHVRTGAKNRVPIKRGRLNRNIKSRFYKEHMLSIVKVNYRKAPYAHFLEFGTEEHEILPKRRKVLRVPLADGYKFMPSATIPSVVARPFMKPAFEAEKPSVVKEIKTVLRTMP